jgi:hypothetical protein
VGSGATSDREGDVEQVLHLPSGDEQCLDVDSWQAVGDEVAVGELRTAGAAVRGDREDA